MSANAPIYEVHDESFLSSTWGDAKLARHCDDCRWAEGPAYFPAGRYLLWSDIPNDRILRYDEITDSVAVYRTPAGYSNGQTVDRQGRLVTCEQGNRRITRTEFDGSVTVLTDRFDGKRYNSPNDVVVRGDGSIWFTDPTYGIRTDYEGFRAEPEQDGNYVYRIDPDGTVAKVLDGFAQPNGLAFSPDESRLFVVDSERGEVRRYDVAGDRLGEPTILPGKGFDGIRFDTEGRLWAGATDGVHCVDQDGRLLGKILVPETVANLVFGGPRRNRLYLAGTTSLYSVMVSVTGHATF